MVEDIDALFAKQSEIEEIARTALQRAGGGPLKFAESVVTNFVRLTGPLIADRAAAVVAGTRSGRGPRRPGSIALNWPKLMQVLPEIIVDATEASSGHVWVVVFIALSIWGELSSPVRQRMGVDEATAMLALWRYRTAGDAISEDDGFAKTNAVRAEIRLPPLMRRPYDVAIERLARLGCLSLAGGMIRLRDSVAVPYE